MCWTEFWSIIQCRHIFEWKEEQAKKKAEIHAIEQPSIQLNRSGRKIRWITTTHNLTRVDTLKRTQRRRRNTDEHAHTKEKKMNGKSATNPNEVYSLKTCAVKKKGHEIQQQQKQTHTHTSKRRCWRECIRSCRGLYRLLFLLVMFIFYFALATESPKVESKPFYLEINKTRIIRYLIRQFSCIFNSIVCVWLLLLMLLLLLPEMHRYMRTCVISFAASNRPDQLTNRC